MHVKLPGSGLLLLALAIGCRPVPRAAAATAHADRERHDTLLPGMPPPLDPNNIYAGAGAGMVDSVARRARPLVYVPLGGAGSVTIIDPVEHRVLRTFATATLPQHVVPAYDLRTLWVANDIGNSLTPIDPMSGKEGKSVPVEMGMKGNEAAIVARIAADSTDAAMFRDAFPNQPITLDTIVKAIASFERTIVSANSSLDRYLYRDDRTALTSQAQRGMSLFFSERLACAQCHAGFNLSGPTVQQGSAEIAPTFHNTGLYNVDGRGAYPAIDRGLFDLTRVGADMGRFRAPTLRNIAVTAPYMHDGSIATLDEVVGHYASGGLKSPFKSPRLKGFEISTAETRDLIAFLNSLTDEEFLSKPELGKPDR